MPLGRRALPRSSASLTSLYFYIFYIFVFLDGSDALYNANVCTGTLSVKGRDRGEGFTDGRGERRRERIGQRKFESESSVM